MKVTPQTVPLLDGCMITLPRRRRAFRRIRPANELLEREYDRHGRLPDLRIFGAVLKGLGVFCLPQIHWPGGFFCFFHFDRK